MRNFEKYEKQYFLPPTACYDWVKKDSIEKPPCWCSVDLRDGNQAMIEPMILEEKIEFFLLLVKIGFKEIEVGYPSASETDFQFVRTLIENRMIPKDVTIQVLADVTKESIYRTFEAVEGATRAIVHIYNPISPVQREQVFQISREEAKKIAVEGAALVQELARKTKGNFIFEYSPESFSATEMEYALEVCNGILDVWKPAENHPCIINLPSTVEHAMPHVFASQVEYIHKNLKYRKGVILSLHTHNDRGCGVAAAELGILAGAQRIEGTLFGNGERTGNTDIVTLSMNLYSHGVDPELDFSDIMNIRAIYERLTSMNVHDRTPYAGNLVFTAFSEAHQDAITKGMAQRKQEKDIWTVPYLPIDPLDIGRAYQKDVIRINSQSGKGGVAFILNEHFGITLPSKMADEVGCLVKEVSDKAHKELSPEWVYQIFEDNYVNCKGVFLIDECHFKQEDGIQAAATISHGGGKRVVAASGNGRLDAVSNAIKQYFNISYELSVYEEHSLTKGSSSKACAYVGVVCAGKQYWGVGIDEDIIRASIAALCIAVNKIDEIRQTEESKEERLVEILNYIQAHYLVVTLDDLSEQFFLSKPYLSKYIKEKSGMTFSNIVKKVRMKKARALLKSSNMTVENIALSVGYQNVEHFNRLFKKTYNMTPVQYRNMK